MKTASIATNKISVSHTIRTDMDREYLTLNVPEGWDDVKNLTNKVLTYEGRDFIYSGWNSDVNQCYFVRLINGPDQVATIR
jgi:hypothetical protein